jgi:type II secretory pathway pseudopilin PulG
MRTRTRDRESGLSLVEVTIATAVIAVVFVAVAQAMLGSVQVAGASTDDAVAMNAAQVQIESMKAAPFSRFFATYHAQTGLPFDVPGLTPPPGRSAPGLVRVLSEAEFARRTGIPADLDGDGSSGGTTPSASYSFFPVKVDVTFVTRNNKTPRTVEIVTAIYDVPPR